MAMDRVRLTRIATVVLPVLGCCALAPAFGQDARSLRTRSLAATCAHCHGTDGRAVANEPFKRLAGQPRDQLLALLMAFRAGERPATVMQQLARGFSPEQLDEIAGYLAAQR